MFSKQRLSCHEGKTLSPKVISGNSSLPGISTPSDVNFLYPYRLFLTALLCLQFLKNNSYANEMYFGMARSATLQFTTGISRKFLQKNKLFNQDNRLLTWASC